ncbi:MAG: hypothetical protein Q8M15_13680 [Bacteroidota bacterium]|nr:hypothetical protein [Bacteroidota bacterium]
MKKILGLLFLSTVLNACYYDKEELLYPNDFGGYSGVVTYANDIKPMLASNCTTSNCHAAGMQSPNLGDYLILKANIAKVENRAIILRNMPAAAPMSNLNINKLKKWIAEGALNN